ncbi:MAG: VCBS domain-containing protein, partial [Betaproteobacteria bacterium]|nr:VCBS domain-containing protein [Betaproteobacteria bacterium]
MLFDGAAMAEAVDASQDVDGPSSQAPEDTYQPSATETQPVVDASDSTEAPVQYFDFAIGDFAPELQEALQEAAGLASQSILDFARQATDEQWFDLFNGGNEMADVAWTSRLNDLRLALLDGSLNFSVQAIDFAVIPDAIAAYTANGPDGGPTIFINPVWANMMESPDLTRVLAEEMGHAFDDILNDGEDTPGEEGERFAAHLLGLSVDDNAEQRWLTKNDHRIIEWSGASYEVDTATFSFVATYEMVYGTVNGAESWALKENSSIWFDTTDLGMAFIDDSSNGQYFSGNDVSAIGLNIGGTDYYGWISRAIKSQGVVRGFYFWTDVDFVDLASAQADGNKDGDNNPYDNRGFVLVIDKDWFEQQSTNEITIDGESVTIANVKSSSDRVDTGLNTAVDSYPQTPPPPVVTAQAESSTAVEEGAEDPGRDASGNVLDNAQSKTGLDLTVSLISAGNSAKDVNDGLGTTIAGKYGTLTIHADGSYEYVVDNANPKVDALNVGGRLNDVFTYTVSDGEGGVASATLTIVIEGQNDAPEANPDYNTA